MLTGYTGSVGSLSVSGREGNRYSYNLVAGDNQFTVGEDGVLSLTAAQNNVESLTLIVQVGDKSEGGSLPGKGGLYAEWRYLYRFSTGRFFPGNGGLYVAGGRRIAF